MVEVADETKFVGRMEMERNDEGVVTLRFHTGSKEKARKLMNFLSEGFKSGQMVLTSKMLGEIGEHGYN